VKTFHIAADLLREAAARKWFLGLGIAITLLLLGLVGGLRLDVVDGALAATRLFGSPLLGPVRPADVALRPIFIAASYTISYGGVAFGLLACSDFAPALLSPGRIEHLLSLPVRRWELLAGTFLGVLTLGLIGSVYGAGGLLLILGAKTGIWTWHPLLAAALAVVGFGTVYSGMLLSAVLVRSTALSAAFGALLLVSGIMAGNRLAILAAMGEGPGRSAFALWSALMPPLSTLADAAADVAAARHVAMGQLGGVIAGCVLFSAAALALAAWRFEEKDF
jgi:ABC-type transport system involved in multi-copper enzyme maturation permease subunit